MLVSYEGDEWLHERWLLGFVGREAVCVVTPHWDIYREDLSEYAILYDSCPTSWPRPLERSEGAV